MKDNAQPHSLDERDKVKLDPGAAVHVNMITQLSTGVGTFKKAKCWQHVGLHRSDERQQNNSRNDFSAAP